MGTVRDELPNGVRYVHYERRGQLVLFQASHTGNLRLDPSALQELAGFPVEGYGAPRDVRMVPVNTRWVDDRMTSWTCEARL